MKFPLSVMAVVAAALAPSVAIAQPAPAANMNSPLAAGAVVYDPQGGVVGKVESLAGDNVVLDTGTVKATLPRTAFGSGAKGPSVNATKAQIEELVAASMAKANAALDAALVPGAVVRGAAGTLIGTVKEVSDGQVLIERDAGPVSLTKAAFAMGPSGLAISLTADELEVAAKGAASSTSSASAQ